MAREMGPITDPDTILKKIAASEREAEQKRWKILQETQTKCFEIQQDVTVNQAKESKKIGKWDEYIRGYSGTSNSPTTPPTSKTIIATGNSTNEVAKSEPSFLSTLFGISSASAEDASNDEVINGDPTIIEIPGMNVSTKAGTNSGDPIKDYWENLPSMTDPKEVYENYSIKDQIAANAEKSEMERWKKLQETQEKCFEIQQDVTVNQAKTQDKMFGKWDEYIRGDSGTSNSPSTPPPSKTTIATGNSTNEVAKSDPSFLSTLFGISSASAEDASNVEVINGDPTIIEIPGMNVSTKSDANGGYDTSWQTNMTDSEEEHKRKSNIETYIAENQRKAELERQAILDKTKKKVDEIQQDVNVNQATQDKIFGKWDEYIRGEADISNSPSATPTTNKTTFASGNNNNNNVAKSEPSFLSTLFGISSASAEGLTDLSMFDGFYEELDDDDKIELENADWNSRYETIVEDSQNIISELESYLNLGEDLGGVFGELLNTNLNISMEDLKVLKDYLSNNVTNVVSSLEDIKIDLKKIDELKKQIETKTEEINLKSQEVEKAEKALSDIKSNEPSATIIETDSSGENFSQSNPEHSSWEINLSNAEKNLTEINNELNNLKSELKELQTELENTKIDMANLLKKIRENDAIGITYSER